MVQLNHAVKHNVDAFSFIFASVFVVKGCKNQVIKFIQFIDRSRKDINEKKGREKLLRYLSREVIVIIIYLIIKI